MRKSFYLYSHERVYSGGGYINKTKLPKGSVLEIVFLFCQRPCGEQKGKGLRCGAASEQSEANSAHQRFPLPTPTNPVAKEQKY